MMIFGIDIAPSVIAVCSFMSDPINPYMPPVSEIQRLPQNPLQLWAILSQAWKIFTERLWVVAAAVMIIWIPCELLSSYMDNFVFAEDDFRKSFKFEQFLDNFFGIISTAGVIFIALHFRSGFSVGFGQALGTGLSSWPRMWWTRFLTNVVLILSFILLLVPFIYLYPRLCLVESVVVNEQISGVAAMKRSFELTRGRYWLFCRLALALSLLLGIPSIILVILPEFIPMIDHWLVDAAIYVVCDVMAAYGTISLYCAYEASTLKQDATP